MLLWWSHETCLHKIYPCFGPNVQTSFAKKKKKKTDFITSSLFFCCHHPWWDWFSLSSFVIFSFVICSEKKKSPSRRLNYSRRQYLFKNKRWIVYSYPIRFLQSSIKGTIGGAYGSSFSHCITLKTIIAVSKFISIQAAKLFKTSIFI